ncbi:MAG TPA: hydrolase [Gemmatimonadaceae bacterium]|jgi:predicted alpha/beta-fold hydrolase|nr:hydrolase [Gemmatimonadaceae bacterium]
MSPLSYRPAWWVPGAHAQTLWGKLVRRPRPVFTRVERWETPDDDFLEIHRLDAARGLTGSRAARTPRVVILHGLEGTVRSHYAQGLLGEMRRRGWGADLVIWRSCGSEPNRARRFYHSGETIDLALVIDRVTREFPDDPLALVGVSLGGNVLLKYLGERGREVPRQLVAAVAISVPFDLARGSAYINRGFSKIYQKYFMDSLKRKTHEKVTRYPDLIARDRIDTLTTLQEFDDAMTAPIHGFADAQAYYADSSAIRYIQRIQVNTLLLNAVDDPFLPPDVLDEVRRIAAGNRCLSVEFPEKGGHAGFVSGWNPFSPVYFLERRTGEFLATRFAAGSESR